MKQDTKRDAEYSKMLRSNEERKHDKGIEIE